MIVENLGYHLLIQTGSTDMVAVCVHPLDLPGQDVAHTVFKRLRIPFSAPDEPINVAILDQREARQQVVELAMLYAGEVKEEAAVLLGIAPKTLRKWVRGA